MKDTPKMQDHYFTQSPASPMRTHKVVYNTGSHSISLTTADGVFSKHEVDFGSDLLIKTILMEQPFDSLLDMGCGYGVIGISLSKVFMCRALMCDINERAVLLAKDNAKDTEAEAIQSDGFQNVSGTFDVIVTNPPIRAGKEVYYKWFDESINYLNPEGRFYCVIQKKQGAPSAIKHLEGIYPECEIIAKDKGYYIIRCTKGNVPD